MPRELQSPQPPEQQTSSRDMYLEVSNLSWDLCSLFLLYLVILTALVVTKLPPTCTFSGLLFPTQTSSCLLGINHSPNPSLPNKSWWPHRTSSPPHIQSPSPNTQPSNHLSPPGHLPLPSWFRLPSSHMGYDHSHHPTTIITTSSGGAWGGTLWATMWRAEG